MDILLYIALSCSYNVHVAPFCLSVSVFYELVLSKTLNILLARSSHSPTVHLEHLLTIYRLEIKTSKSLKYYFYELPID